MVYREVKVPTLEPKEEEKQESSQSSFWSTALTVGAVAGSVLMAWGAHQLLSSEPGPSDPHPSTHKDKDGDMVAPGRGSEIPRKKIPRKDFLDPDYRRDYFKRLREDEKLKKKAKQVFFL